MEQSRYAGVIHEPKIKEGLTKRWVDRMNEDIRTYEMCMDNREIWRYTVCTKQNSSLLGERVAPSFELADMVLGMYSVV